MKRFSLSAVFACLLFQSYSQDNSRMSSSQLITVEGNRNKSQVQEILRQSLNLKENDQLRSFRVETDQLGFVHEKFQQYYKGVKVDGAVNTGHYKNSIAISISGTFININDLNVTPAISPVAAFDKALAHVHASVYAWEGSVRLAFPDYEKPKGELVIVVDRQAGISPTLAYKFDIYAARPLYRAWIYIDAKTGSFVKAEERIHEANSAATANTRYDGVRNITADFTGSAYRLRQTASGNGVETYSLKNGTSYTGAVDITSTSNSFTGDPTSNQAHFGAEQTYNYYKLKHNRNSYDNAGGILRSYTHYSTNYVNAFWDGTRMTYGDGNGTTAGPLVSLDICGHELTHGVTGHTAGLNYSNESGALNESYSDIFGEAIENYVRGSNDWLMANDIKLGTGTAFRSMMNPNQFNDPDTYKGLYWYSGTGDNGGVHTNSGVQNKWFYILTVGETGSNDLGNAYNVAGVGLEMAAKVAYRALTVYLSSSSDYYAARAASIQAATDLSAPGSPLVIATTNAWYAVGVGCEYGANCYCTSAGTSATSMWISSVNAGTYTNASGSSGYTDFTANTISLSAGTSVPVNLTPGYASTAYSVYWKVWIDYNKDGDFEDANELVFSKGLTNTIASGSFTVLPGITVNTRMRVSMKYNAAQTACEKFSSGEVEDYTVNITNTADNTPPSSPSLTSTGATTNTISLSWTAATDNIGVAGYDVFVNGAKNGSTTSATTFTVTGLTPATPYSIYVLAKDAANNSTPSNTINVTTASVTTTTIFAHYFETGMDGWADGGNDCSRYQGSRSYEGTYSISLRDNQGLNSSMTSASRNVSAYNQIVVDFYFYATGMENGDDFWLRYFNGSSWATVATFVAGSHFSNNGFYHATVTLNTVAFPANAQFRFQCDASENNDLMYIDAVVVKGNAGGSVPANNSQTCVFVSSLDTDGDERVEGINGTPAITKVIVYPNPVGSSLNILGNEQITETRIYNSTGVLIANFNKIIGNKINVANLKPGVYIIKFLAGDQWFTRKFVKK